MKKITFKHVKELFDNNYFLRDYNKIKTTIKYADTEYAYQKIIIFYDKTILDIDLCKNYIVGSATGFITTICMREFCDIIKTLENEVYNND